MKIHWYPGHMKKSSNDLLERIKKIDIIIELVDARAPTQTRNLFFEKITNNKIYILVYTKSDLADLSFISNEEKKKNFLISIKKKSSINFLYSYILNIIKKYNLNKNNHLVIIAIIGIPNIGKSSLINAFLNKKKVKVENRPGVTKNNQLININEKFYILDTAGILPTKFIKPNYFLALTGAIKIELLPIIELSDFAYDFIVKNYPFLYIKRYGPIQKNSYESFKYISNIYHIKNDKSLNFEFARTIFLKDIRDGKIGKIYFEI